MFFSLHQTPSSAPRACYKYPPAAVYPLIQPKLLPKHLHQLKKRIGTNLSVKYVAARWPLYWYFSSPLPAPGGWAWSWHTIRLLQKANQSAELIPLKNTGEKGINNQGGARGGGIFITSFFLLHSLVLPREQKSVRFSDGCLLFNPEECSLGHHQDLPNTNPPELQDEKTIHQRGANI